MTGRLPSIHTELDRLFDEVLRLASPERRAGEHEPPIDVVETADEMVVLAEVPGIAREDLEVFVEGRTVVIAGVKRLQPPGGVRRFHGVEREQGRFERRIELLGPVNTHRGRGRLADGVLIVSFPRVEERRTARRPVVIEEAPAGEPGEPDGVAAMTVGDQTT